MFRRDRQDKGNLAVLESMIVGFIVIAGVASVATMHEPTSTSSAARQRMTESSADVLQILAELSASDPTIYASRLDEIVTLALQGDSDPLDENLTSLLPTGSEFEVYLDNGQGGEVPVLTNGEFPSTESVTSSHLVNPHWSYLVVQPRVENVSSIVPLAAITNVVVPPITNTLTLQAILVRNGYIDSTTDVSLTFPNVGHSAFTTVLTGKHIRTSNTLQPEYVANLTNTYQRGFPVPYDLDTTAHYLVGTGSTTDLTQAQLDVMLTHNVASAAQPRGSTYSVHPKYTLAATVSQALTSLNATGGGFQTDSNANPQYGTGQTVHFSWNYNTLATSVLANARTIRVYNPAGGVMLTNVSTSNVLQGTFDYTIPQASLWGTYVAEIELSLKDPVSQSKVYLVHAMTYFNVNPPTGYSWNQQHIPPTYRVILNSWLGDWNGGGSALTGTGGGSGDGTGTGGGGLHLGSLTHTEQPNIVEAN